MGPGRLSPSLAPFADDAAKMLLKHSDYKDV